MNKVDLFTDNIEHYIEEIEAIALKLKRFKHIPSYTLDKDIEQTDCLYRYMLDELTDLQNTIIKDDEYQELNKNRWKKI